MLLWEREINVSQELNLTQYTYYMVWCRKIIITTWSCVVHLKWWYLHNRTTHTVALKMAENQQEYPGVASYTVNVKVHALRGVFVDRDQPLMLLFLPIMLCCNALKFYVLCSRTRTVVRLLCYLYTSLHEQLTTSDRQFL